MSAEAEKSPAEAEAEARHRQFEASCGLIIAILAAALAVTDIGAGRYGDDEMIAHSQRASAFQWYQSKGVKENLAESERDLLQALLDAGAIAEGSRAGMEARLTRLDDDIARYGREKKEILRGSKAVGPDGWAQEQDGELGKIVGALEWESIADALEGVGDRFDVATFFLQISLVMGAVALLVDAESQKRLFRAVMVGLGLIGSVFSLLAYLGAWAT